MKRDWITRFLGQANFQQDTGVELDIQVRWNLGYKSIGGSGEERSDEHTLAAVKASLTPERFVSCATTRQTRGRRENKYILIKEPRLLTLL